MGKPLKRQQTCTMNNTQYELFQRLLQRLVLNDLTSEMELYTINTMSNTKKMHILLTEVDRLTDDKWRPKL